MSYTNAWNEATPAGASAANTIDDHMRQIKLDVRERINSVIGVAIGTALSDPVVPAGTDLTALKSVNDTQTTNITTLQGLTGSQNLSLWLPWTSAFIEEPIVQLSSLAYVQKYQSNGALYYTGGVDGLNPYISPLSFSLVLPVGVTITGAIGYFNRATANENATLTLYSLSNTGTRSAIASVSGTTGASGDFNVSLGVLSTTTLVDVGYFIRVTFAQVSGQLDPRFYGIKLSYTSPDTTKRV